MKLTPRMKDHTGTILGSLTAIHPSHKTAPKRAVTWKWLCKCGGTVFEEYAVLKRINKNFNNPEVPSCGCVKKKVARAMRLKHNLSRHPLYTKYQSMRERCYVPTSQSYDNYGAKGITICDAWKDNPEAFIKWCLANGWKPGLHLDKDMLCEQQNISPKLYAPHTCQFITASENTIFSNKKRNL